MFILAEIPDPNVPAWLAALVLAMLVAGSVVYWGLLVELFSQRGKLRTHVMNMPDFIASATTGLILAAMCLPFWLGTMPQSQSSATGIRDLVSGSFIQLMMAAVALVLPMARHANLADLYFPRRLGSARTFLIGFGLILAFLPLHALISHQMLRLQSGRPKLQPLVEQYQAAVAAGDWQFIGAVALTAGLIAPVCEELLFRGYMYQACKRYLGTLPSALGCAILFAAIHNNLLGFPSLALLAIALTIAFEWSGSIAVPIVMHACFNLISLAYMALEGSS